MQPLWKVGGTALGFVSSLLGEKYVNACTEAIESTIVDHYQEQVKYLKKINERSDLRKNIMKFCDEENQHKLSSQKKNDNEKGTFLFKQITKNITKLAIKISKKL
jgi:ubiquinone biosynthesis monooxygenase Coq7